MRQIGFNALHPYIVKLEPILDGDKKHNRLGFFVNTVDHIATLNPKQVQQIQQCHAAFYCRVTGQELAPKRRSESSEEWVEFGSPQEQLDVYARLRPDEEIKRDDLPAADRERLPTTEPVVAELEPREPAAKQTGPLSTVEIQPALPLFEIIKEPRLDAYMCKKAESGNGRWVMVFKPEREPVGNREWQLVGPQEPLQPFVDPKMLPSMKIEGNRILKEVVPGKWEVVSTVEPVEDVIE